MATIHPIAYGKDNNPSMIGVSKFPLSEMTSRMWEITARVRQIDRMIEWMLETDLNLPAIFSIFGGDLNFDLFDNQGLERPNYEKIIEAGFLDSYAIGQSDNLEDLCEDEDNADVHCTVGVSELNGKNARRIDYIFSNLDTIETSKVVFNTLVEPGQPTVSDHAGVFVRFNIGDKND